ncbi:MAG: ATPase [Clostridiales bacterium]|nr:ATPase [Clostridiales bacterium]
MGLEFGSTRIKAVLTDKWFAPIAFGSHTWENKLQDSIWTYSYDDIWGGLRRCYAELSSNVSSKYGVSLKKIGAIGFSGMMHGYMAFDQDDRLLVPFRTWRNTITGRASEELTKLFDFNIPQRWSIAHLYQAILNGEEHVARISYLTTLSGYIHWKLTGVKAVGVCEASGMFPIETSSGQFDKRMTGVFNEIINGKYAWRLEDIMPRVLQAGDSAGFLTKEGAGLLDPTGMLKPGIPVCPPEGDAGTGMVATNSIAAHTGNISAGTSIFAMLILEKELKGVYPEIDIATTPAGKPVAMVHCNNGSSDIDAWVSLFGELLDTCGVQTDKDKLYSLLFEKALEGEEDCSGLLSYNYFTGEPVTGLDEGRPLLVRKPDSRLTLSNFMRTQLFSSVGALRMGMDILLGRESVKVGEITGHGGFFKSGSVYQKILAAALGIPVKVMHTAGEGGPWGMAILAAVMVNRQPGEALADYLKNKVFNHAESATMEPDPSLAAAFDGFLRMYIKGLELERTAIRTL